MNLSELKPAAGSKHSDEFRRGRGHGSGNGKTSLRQSSVQWQLTTFESWSRCSRTCFLSFMTFSGSFTIS